MSSKEKQPAAARYPGRRMAIDGSAAVVEMETAGSEAAGAYPITPSTQMGEGWALAVAAGRPNVNGRKLLFFEPEGEHAAAAVTAGMNMTGLRATNFSSGQGIAYMHESLYAAVGKRLTYVLNVACRAMTKHALNVHAGHDDYHAVDDTGFFQLFAKDVQQAADFNLICHRIAELSLNPGLCAQDGFLTSHVIETMDLPERELVKAYLGDPSDLIDSPTPAQRLVFGEQRRRVPELFDYDAPAMLGVVQNQDSYAQGVAAQRPFYFDHLRELTDRALDEFAALTGRRYARAIGYRLDDAEYVIAGQGSLVANAEAVADHLRAERGLKVGVLQVAMFRPFPADLLSRLLKGKRAVAVLERTDQPLAVEGPLLREIRAAMGQATENHRGNGRVPYAEVEPCAPEDVPAFYSGCYGLGSRDLQPGDLVAAVENMLPDGKGRRQFYLGIDFVREGTRLPKLQIWQDRLLESYPHLKDLALKSAGDLNLMPAGSISIRMHSIGGWGAITTGKNVALTAADLLGLHIKANPKYGSEKKGQPTTFYATLAEEPIRLNCELKHVNVVLSPDPNVFRHSNPLAGLEAGGVFVIQNDQGPEALWAGLPRVAQRTIREKNLKVFGIDAFRIATAEASDPELRIRMQGVAFMGAFFRCSPLMARYGLDEDKLFDGIRATITKKFGHLGERVVEDNLRVIRRGFDEVFELDVSALEESGDEAGATPQMPSLMESSRGCPAISDSGRFWEQVGYLYKTGSDGIADPFAALSALPAATSAIRDMTDVRFEVPKFLAEKCTGCGACWTQCPDAAIPGLVNTVEEVLETAVGQAGEVRPLDRMRQAVRPLANEARKILRSGAAKTFAPVLRQAYQAVAPKLAAEPERRAQLDEEFGAVYAVLEDVPLARTAPFFDVPEGREKNSGGLLSVTINPQTCKGCNECVEVCPDGALVTIRQTDEHVDEMRRHWALWEKLPDTDDRYINVTDLDEGIGVLSSLLLKKETYRSMVGGDGSCSGCGEKTGVHLVLSAVNALLLPKVKAQVERLDDLIARLDARARELLASDADLEGVDGWKSGHAELPLDDGKKIHVARIARMIRDLEDLRWRYTEGPTGKGRATAGFANATGCSSVWGSTYPYNPYPFPWVNHLFQDAPSIALGIFEGHMRKMADGFRAVRRAELELADDYDPEVHEPFLRDFDWRRFSDEEFALCPPILAVGGDGALLDIGFQNLSRLMASGKPIRVVLLDTQVYSNTGGQACTSGFLGQVSDMAAYGAAQHGKEEVRKEISLIAMGHRGTFVVQASQANASHLLAGVIKGLQERRPALFVLHSPCPPEHGIGDDSAMHQAKLALESRAFPLLTYDPDGGENLADRLDLEGNPSLDDDWPVYDLKYLDDEGNEQVLAAPLTIADWAATEARFKKHFRPVRDQAEDDLVAFHEYLGLPADEREDKTPFIHVIDRERKLRRMTVSDEIVELAEDRLAFWHQLKELAGIRPAESVRDELTGELEAEFERKLSRLRAEYEARLAELRSRYPVLVARRLADGLLRSGNGSRTVGELLSTIASLPEVRMPRPSTPATAPAAAPAATATAAPEAPAAVEEADEGIALEPYIESARCTTCHECTNLNNKLFAYNEKKQAYIKDPRAGTFKQLVMAAEKCPVAIIHPGTPLNPKEKGLDKLIERAKRFN